MKRRVLTSHAVRFYLDFDSLVLFAIHLLLVSVVSAKVIFAVFIFHKQLKVGVSFWLSPCTVLCMYELLHSVVSLDSFCIRYAIVMIKRHVFLSPFQHLFKRPQMRTTLTHLEISTNSAIRKSRLLCTVLGSRTQKSGMRVIWPLPTTRRDVYRRVRFLPLSK